MGIGVGAAFLLSCFPLKITRKMIYAWLAGLLFLHMKYFHQCLVRPVSVSVSASAVATANAPVIV